MNASQQALEILSNRELGQIPISIGTSLGLEGAFGILEDQPNPNPIIHKVDVLYVNVRTLVRNLIGAVEAEQVQRVFPEDLALILLNELVTLDEAVRSFTSNRVGVEFYLCSYRSLSRKFPYAILKNANTDKQKMAALREEHTVTELLDRLKLQPHLKVHETDLDLPKDPRKVLLMTNYAVDLLQRYQFGAVTLLESHTGAAKPPALWHTKLTGGKDLPMIPFDRMTLQFFGDGSNLFTGFPIKFRRVLLGIAEKNKWTAMTTKEYVISCVKKAYEPELERLVINLYAKH